MSVTIRDKDRGLKRIVKQMKEIDNAYVKVGVLSNAGNEKNGMTIADVATFNEYGTSKIPARPFMKQAYENNEKTIIVSSESLKSDVFKGEISVKGALKKLGVWFKGRIQKEITDGDFVPNAPRTIEAKGSDKPLIDTGRMRQSINFQIETGEGKK